MTVRTCDVCDAVDNDEVMVRRYTVVGPKRELCEPCAIDVLGAAGVAEDLGKRYMAHLAEAETKRGTKPSLRAVAAEAEAEAAGAVA